MLKLYVVYSQNSNNSTLYLLDIKLRAHSNETNAK